MTKQTDDLTKQYCRDYEKATGHLPLIFDQFVYRFFGDDSVKIVEANVFSSVKDAEVTIEDGWGERKAIEFRELMVKP